MPISRIQSEILEVIARLRDPESFIAGGVPIDRDGPRVSADIDIFHDRMQRRGHWPSSPEIAMAMLERYLAGGARPDGD